MIDDRFEDMPPWMCPPWATKLERFLGRVTYKPWLGLTMTIQVHDTLGLGPMNTVHPEVQYFGSKLYMHFRAPDAREVVQIMQASQIVWNDDDFSMSSRSRNIDWAANVTKVRFGRPLPPWVLMGRWFDEQMFQWVRKEIHWLENHEADELLCLDGVPLAYPH